MKTKPAILVVCGKARKRSRTAEILYQNFAEATVWAAGVSPKADRKMREDDLLRADVVLVMEPDHRNKIESLFRHLDLPLIEVLHIPDEYEVMDPELAAMLRGHIDAVLEGFSQGDNTFMKDNFSAHATDYAHYRPQYPQELYDFILEHVPGRERAWDCGAGNGQMSAELAKYFGAAYATDISAEQLAQAPALPNVAYSVQPAEGTDFPDKQFDLITVAQAIHWFDFDRFYAEVRRVAVPGALLCAVGYNIIRIDPQTDALIDHFYHRITRKYWDDERRHIDAEYASIPFPFREIPAPSFESRYRWTLEQLIGYLNTWSGVKHFIKANGYNPVNDLEAHLRSVWRDGEEKEVVFPVFLRAGVV